MVCDIYRLFFKGDLNYLFYNKNEVYGCFQSSHKMIETQGNAKLHVLRSDNGREHLDKNCQEYLTKNGIVSQLICVNKPQQIGIAESKITSLRSGSIIDLYDKDFQKYWGDSILTTSHLINQMPISVLGFKVMFPCFHPQ